MRVKRKAKRKIIIIDKFCILLTVCLVVLKLYGVYPISWVEAFIPLMATAAIYMYLLALTVGYVAMDILARKHQSNKENDNV